jgi:DNA-binding transcriptional regulator YiaG
MRGSLQERIRVNSPKELREAKPKDFDKAVAVSVGRRIRARRTLCGLSTQQFGNRLGIDVADVEAHELGEKRISARLLLETAKVLRARPIFFFQ